MNGEDFLDGILMYVHSWPELGENRVPPPSERYYSEYMISCFISVYPFHASFPVMMDLIERRGGNPLERKSLILLIYCNILCMLHCHVVIKKTLL